MSYALYAALYARVLRAFGGNTTASCRDRLLRQVSSPGASPLSAPFLVSDTPISFSLFKAVFRGTLKFQKALKKDKSYDTMYIGTQHTALTDRRYI